MNILRILHLIPLGALALSMILASCDSQGMVAGGSDETHSSIDIQGRVLTKDSRPYGNVIVRLRGLGLYDTTDSDGLFRFQRDSVPVAARAASAVDTIDYMRDGQTVLSAAVPAWIATMPDVMLVQRDLSGQLTGPIEDISRVVCELGTPDGYHHELDLELNPYTKRYSGFAYFRYTGGTDSFTVWVKTLDDSGRMLGRSRLLRFSSKAGDVAFPEFGAKNAVPSVRLLVETATSTVKGATSYPTADTVNWRDSIRAAGRQTIHLHALVTDSFRSAARVEWNFGSGWVKAPPSIPISITSCPSCYRDTATPGAGSAPIRILYHFETTVTVPADAKWTWRPMVRVVDSQGNTASDTIKVTVVDAPPFASVWLTPPSEVLPGSKLPVSLDDSDSFGGKVVSRKLYLGRYSQVATSGWISCIQILYPDSGWSNQVYLPSCAEKETEHMVTAYFHPLDTGWNVSGADTTLTLPIAETGIFQALYEVVDDDGNKTVIRSGTVVVRPVAPRLDSIVPRPDSVDVHWTSGAEILTTTTLRRGWKLQGSWKGSIDTFAIELDWASRKVRIPRPDGAYALQLSIRQMDGTVPGFPRDTIIENLPKPVLAFTGAALDPRALRGEAFVIEPASARLFGTTGAFLSGDVARLDWAVGDSFAMSAAGSVFRIVPTEAPKNLHLDVANHSSLPVRIFLNAPSNAEYSKLVERRIDLGWDVPAGFEGRLDLALDSATWSQGASQSDTSAIDRNVLNAGLGGVGFRITRPQEPVLRSGILEIDNIAWE